MGLPLQEAFPRMGEIRGFHVPPKYPSRLGAASTPEVQHLRQRTIKPLYLTSYLLVQACQHLWLVHCDDAAAVHLCSPYDSILAPLRRAVLAELRPFHKALSRVSPKDTLSRKLHTRRLLSTHVSVGYRQQNAGFYIAVKQLKQLFKRLHVALIDSAHSIIILQWCTFPKIQKISFLHFGRVAFKILPVR